MGMGTVGWVKMNLVILLVGGVALCSPKQTFYRKWEPMVTMGMGQFLPESTIRIFRFNLANWLLRETMAKRFDA